MLGRAKQKLRGINRAFPETVFVFFGDIPAGKLIWIDDSSRSNREKIKIAVVTVRGTGGAGGRDTNSRDQVRCASGASPDAIIHDVRKSRAFYVGFKDDLPIAADGNRNTRFEIVKNCSGRGVGSNLAHPYE